jgi:dinuclear metal center YbgI/SA1388 family protein
MKIKDIINIFEEIAPVKLQETYDNSGLCTGNAEHEIKAVLITIDITPEVVEEAIQKKCNLIIAHHPLIFKGLKKITGDNYIEKSIINAIKNDIAIFTAHTNIDLIYKGVSNKICEKLELKNRKILVPKQLYLNKIITFVPQEHAPYVRNAMFSAGAGHIGEYSACSYNINGKGSFKAEKDAKPFVGETGKIHFEDETRIEMIFPDHLQNKIIKEMISAHPYEEVAYDIIKLQNSWDKAGLGMYGDLEKEISETDFFDRIKDIFNVKIIKHSDFLNKNIKRVAVCGGSGAGFIQNAINCGADIYITGDIKYHDFFTAEKKILLADIGHYESEQFTKEIFYDIINKNNINFAVLFSDIVSNPINVY